MSDTWAFQTFPIPCQLADEDMRPKGITATLIRPRFINSTLQIVAKKNAAPRLIIQQAVFAMNAAQIALAKLRRRHAQERREAMNFLAIHEHVALLAAARAAIRLALEAQAIFVEFVCHLKSQYKKIGMIDGMFSTRQSSPMLLFCYFSGPSIFSGLTISSNFSAVKMPNSTATSRSVLFS